MFNKYLTRFSLQGLFGFVRELICNQYYIRITQVVVYPGIYSFVSSDGISRKILLCIQCWYIQEYTPLYPVLVYPGIYSPVSSAGISRNLLSCIQCWYIKESTPLYPVLVYPGIYSLVSSAGISRNILPCIQCWYIQESTPLFPVLVYLGIYSPVSSAGISRNILLGSSAGISRNILHCIQCWYIQESTPLYPVLVYPGICSSVSVLVYPGIYSSVSKEQILCPDMTGWTPHVMGWYLVLLGLLSISRTFLKNGVVELKKRNVLISSMIHYVSSSKVRFFSSSAKKLIYGHLLKINLNFGKKSICKEWVSKTDCKLNLLFY